MTRPSTRCPSHRHRPGASSKFLVAAASLCFSLYAIAGDVTLHLVKDIGTELAAAHSEPRRFRRVGDHIYFNATTPLLGRELYRTDGVMAQPELVADFVPGTGSSYAKAVGIAGGRLVVEADDGMLGDRLFAFDRASGSRTTLLVFGSGGDQLSVTPVAQLADHVLFRTLEQLYTTDGTAAGTTRLFENDPHSANIAKTVCPLPGGGALFVAASATAPVTLWHTDGPRASNRIVAALSQESAFASVSGDGSRCWFLFARSGGWSVWSSDGASANLMGVQAGAAPRGIAAASSFAYVVDTVGQGAFRLWRTDSSLPVFSVPLSWVSSETFMRTVGDRVVFAGPYDDTSGSPQSAVYVSDGTAAGTARVTPHDGLQAIDDWSLTAVRSNALLVGRVSGIWSIDPAARTVVRVGDGMYGFNFGEGVEFGGALVGVAYTDTSGSEVFRSDGSAPALLHDLWQSTASGVSYYGYDAVNIGDSLYFGHVGDSSQPWSIRQGLWRTDGSDAGTQPLPRSRYGEGSVASIVRFGDGIVFGTQSPDEFHAANADFTQARRIVQEARYPTLQAFGTVADGGALMGCDGGQPFPDHHLCALHVGEAQASIVAPNLYTSGLVSPIGSAGSVALFFLRSSAGTYDGLWRSDGTAPGTFRLSSDIRVLMPEYPLASFVLGSRLLFHGCNAGASQCGLYASDGTTAGTQFIASLPVARIVDFAPLGTRAMFSLGRATGNQLWVTDGTTAGTELLRSFRDNSMSRLASAGGRVHFVAATGTVTPFVDYYVSDGTQTGTRAMLLPPQLSPVGDPVFAVDAETIAFHCIHPDAGLELCFADADGSRVRVTDTYPGPDGSRPAFVGRTDSAVYIAADDGYHGMELWQLKAASPMIFRDGFEPPANPGQPGRVTAQWW